MDVEVEVKRLPACRVELLVKAAPSLVSQARKDAIKKVNKEVTLPGFRPGKAPEELVLKKYGFAVEKEWHKCIADLSYVEAQRSARVPLLNGNTQISFDLKKHSLDEGAELTFSFETEPVVPTVDPKLFQKKEIEKKLVTEQQIDEAIYQARYYFANWTPVTDRGAQDGDTVILDLETVEGDQAKKVFDHIRFELSEARMAKWMQKLIYGAKAGDILEGVSEPDEGEDLKPKNVRIFVHKVEKAELPEVTDEFANKMGAKDVASMRETVRTLLQKNLDDDVQMQMREQVNQFLVNTYHFELPLSLIETERAHRRAQAESEMEALSEDERKKFNEKLFVDASLSVRLFYLARQIVRDANISITHSEVQHEAAQIAHTMQQKIDPNQIPKELFALALSKLLLAKAQDYLLAQAPNKVLDPQESQPV